MTRILVRMGYALDLSGATTGIRVGDAASFVFTALGGQPPYQIRVSEEDLPAEWSFLDNGNGTYTVSTGAAVDPGTFTFTLVVRDALRQEIARSYVVYVQPLALSLTGTPDPASEGVPYTFDLTRLDGQGAITITEQSGFPDFLSAAVLGTTVQITGTPDTGSSAGSPYTPSVTIQDEAGLQAVWSESLSVSASSGFPVLKTAAGESDAALSTSHLVPLFGEVENGDLMLVLICTADDSAVTTPSGWTALDSALLNAAEDGADRFGAYYRVIDGSETSPVDFVTGVACAFAAWSFLYTAGTFTGAPEIEAIGGTSTGPDAISLSPTWGSQKTTWIAAQGNVGGGTTTAFPLPNDQFFVEGGMSGIRIASSSEDDEVASKDPGAFTISNSVDWRAYTIAIRGTG